uniref:Uncharacterized protein n=1 Tax=Xiphophorus maculatus TaxID=8083 RepID=A0A3B5QBD9_XIPMA
MHSFCKLPCVQIVIMCYNLEIVYFCYFHIKCPKGRKYYSATARQANPPHRGVFSSFVQTYIKVHSLL